MRFALVRYRGTLSVNWPASAPCPSDFQSMQDVSEMVVLKPIAQIIGELFQKRKIAAGAVRGDVPRSCRDVDGRDIFHA